MSMEADENSSKYFEIDLDSMDNVSELTYREKIQPREKDFDLPKKWIRNMRREKLKIPLILEGRGVKFAGSILEIGAGSCWFSSMLSKFPEVEEIYALDFSERILTRIAPAMMDHLGANAGKIVRVKGSFYSLVSLGKQFDFVVCDETLHHADHPIKLLREINGVLKRDGCIVFIREPIAPNLPIFKYVSKRVFGREEKKYGVTENIYTVNEWRELFSKGGFDVTIHSLRLRSKSLLSRLYQSQSAFQRVYRAVYGVGSMPVAFVGEKAI